MGRKKKPPVICECFVDSLSHDGKGVARIDGKTVFIEGALAGEHVRIEKYHRRRSYDQGKLLEILQPSSLRVEPVCEYFGTCGGCALQHIDYAAQIEAKETVVRENLNRIGGLEPAHWLPSLSGHPSDYRRKARLGIRDVEKKGGVLIGFRERNKSYITSLRHCLTLRSEISALLDSLHVLVEQLSCRNRLPQIEVAVADQGTALVFRHLVALTEEDLAHIREFAIQHSLLVYLQSGGLDSLRLFHPVNEPVLSYRLEMPKKRLKLTFGVTDFIQVNEVINQLMIEQALHLLELEPTSRVLDAFCGLGNFTLPISLDAASVLGLESSEQLIGRARQNTLDNEIRNVDFAVVDLHLASLAGKWMQPRFDRVLLDPPRSGAIELVSQMRKLAPKRIVYVSCNPATLARDAEVLVKHLHYRLSAVGVIDMFPHTAHVESMAVFEDTV